MESSLERKLQLWDEASLANEAQTKADGKQWRRTYFVYMGVIAATVAIATALAHLAQ